MSQGDIRAVDNPISAIFDLAEEVNEEVPRVRKLVTYATVFMGIWLLIDFALVLATLGGMFVVSLLLMALFVIGILALAMLRNLNDFMRYYSLRHAAIQRVRNDDPIIYAPKGDTAVLRLFEYLRQRNPSMQAAITARSYQTPAILKGVTGVFYNFDGYLSSSSSALWKTLGFGYPGYQLFIKVFGNSPRPEDLRALKASAQDVANATKMPPSRVIALWTRKAAQDLSDEAYEELTSAPIVFSHRRSKFASSLELFIENEDGTYEFIPFIADVGYFSAPRAQ